MSQQFYIQGVNGTELGVAGGGISVEHTYKGLKRALFLPLSSRTNSEYTNTHTPCRYTQNQSLNSIAHLLV